LLPQRGIEDILAGLFTAAGIKTQPDITRHGGLAQYTARALEKGWTEESLRTAAEWCANKATKRETPTDLVDRLSGMMRKKAGEAPPVDIDTTQPRRPETMSPPVGTQWYDIDPTEAEQAGRNGLAAARARLPERPAPEPEPARKLTESERRLVMQANAERRREAQAKEPWNANQ
jgi:hypothetical protein